MLCPFCGAKVSRLVWRSPTRCPQCEKPVELAFRGTVFFAWLVGLVAASFAAGHFLGSLGASSLLPGIGAAPIIALIASGYLRKGK